MTSIRGRLNRAGMLLAVGAMAAAGGCNTLNQALGNSKTTPDEFRVVAKAPLVVPPEFNLRPPRPGESRPLELRPDLQARSAIFGVSVGGTASAGERLFVERAGATNADPRIRDILDSEAGDLVRKPFFFSDRLLGRSTGPMDDAATIDASAEAERLRAEQSAIANSTGGEAGRIQQNRPGRIKLPGL